MKEIIFFNENSFEKDGKNEFMEDMEFIRNWISSYHQGQMDNAGYYRNMAVFALLASKNINSVSLEYSVLGQPSNDNFVKYTIDSIGKELNSNGLYLFPSFGQPSLFIKDKDRIVGIIYSEYTFKVEEKKVNFIGDEKYKELFKELIPKITFPKVEFTDEITRLYVNGTGVICEQTVSRKTRRLKTDPKIFWPYLKESPEEVFKGFMESDASVIVLYGDPGLGKTQFFHELLALKKKGITYSTDNKEVFNHSEFIERLIGFPENTWFVSEDGMEMLRKRDNGNSVMVGILNATQGLSSGNTKFFISTNISDLSEIDEALIRPGRTYRAIKFEYLTPEQGNALRKEHGLPEIDFGNKSKVTLAEALNWEEYVSIESQRRSFGFNN